MLPHLLRRSFRRLLPLFGRNLDIIPCLLGVSLLQRQGNMKAFFSFSESFVSPLFPQSGDVVVLSIAFSSEPENVLLRADDDNGLLSTYEMRRQGYFNNAYLYTASARVTATGEPFRFFFAFIENGRSWYYSKAGITRNTPRLGDRFSLIPSIEAPSWVASSTCYQIFPDRFFRGDESLGAREGEYEFDGGRVTTPSFDSAPRPFSEARCLDFYNGDIPGIIKKLPYLKELGVTALYLNPIFDSRTTHRYDTADFMHVDPKLGGDEAYASLVAAAHEMGIHIILDISINHTGTEALWFRKAMEDKESEEHGYYYFEDGNVRCWQGVKTLPQLNYNSQALRDRMYRLEESVMQKYIRPPFSQDGWRLDVSPEVGRTEKDHLTKEVWREVRKSLKAVKKDLYLVGEDWDDSTEYMQGDTWDATMNYYGVSRPLRSWMGERDRFLTPGWGHDPVREPCWNGWETAEALRAAISSVPDQSAFFQMNLIDSHDTPRLHNDKAVFSRSIYIGVVLAYFSLPGMPSIYYGDENLIDGEMRSVEASRYPMCWDEGRWDKCVHEAYRKMAELRKQSFFPYAACRIEGVDDDCFVIERIASSVASIALINKCPRRRKVSLDLFALPHGRISVWYGEAEAAVVNGTLDVSLPPQSSAVIILTQGQEIQC